MFSRIAVPTIGFCSIPVLAVLAQRTALVHVENSAFEFLADPIWMWVALTLLSISGLAFLTREMVLDQKWEEERTRAQQATPDVVEGPRRKEDFRIEPRPQSRAA